MNRRRGIIGCLSSIVILICCGGISAGVAFGILSGIKNSDAYQLALSTVQNNPQAQAVLGTPIEDGFFFTGSIETSGASGSASFAMPVSGPDGSGSVQVSAVRSAGTWELTFLTLTVEGSGERLDLLR